LCDTDKRRAFYCELYSNTAIDTDNSSADSIKNNQINIRIIIMQKVNINKLDNNVVFTVII
jgi:hypothetical protein